MSAFDDTMRELREMRSHYDSGFSLAEKTRIIELYWRVLNKKIRDAQCPDCYRDAFIETFTTLQRLGKLPEEKHYRLKEGKCLHLFGTSDYLFDVTDEQAEKFLAQIPTAIVQFASFPDDWEERVKRRMQKETYKKAAEKRASKRNEKQSKDK